MIRVMSELKVYEFDGKSTSKADGGKEHPPIHVHSHWNRRDFVTLEICGSKYTLIGEDIIEAIRNAQNVGAR